MRGEHLAFGCARGEKGELSLAAMRERLVSELT